MWKDFTSNTSVSSHGYLKHIVSSGTFCLLFHYFNGNISHGVLYTVLGFIVILIGPRGFPKAPYFHVVRTPRPGTSVCRLSLFSAGCTVLMEWFTQAILMYTSHGVSTFVYIPLPGRDYIFIGRVSDRRLSVGAEIRGFSYQNMVLINRVCW